MHSKTSLLNSNIIISYRENSNDRKVNLYTNLRYLNKNFTDYRIILIEADTAPKFDWTLLSDSKVEHYFIYDNGSFPKATLYNRGVKIASSDVIILLDADCLLNPESITQALSNLTNEQDADAWCVFDHWIDVFGKLKQEFVDTLDYSILANISRDNIHENVVIWNGTAPGGIIVMRRSEYIRVGGLNEGMKGWGGEDIEFQARAKRLGVRWPVMQGVMAHLYHDSFDRSSENKNSVDYIENHNALKEMLNFTDSELTEQANKMKMANFSDYVARISKAAELPAVTVVVTACGRPDLLERTMNSFFEFNTYKNISKIIVIEDSGIKNINDGLKSKWHNILWIDNNEQLGQLESIDKAYAQVDTPYIFHCEDDWEFFKSGFIEASLAILEKDRMILMVWLRAHNDTNGHPFKESNAGHVYVNENIMGYKLLEHNYRNKWHGFSFNPGLRRLRDYRQFFPNGFCQSSSTGSRNDPRFEVRISETYKQMGFYAAIIDDSDGFVKHTGWERHIQNNFKV